MLASGQKIVPEKTLIIFDEVQDCPKVIGAMKYFCENAPQWHWNREKQCTPDTQKSVETAGLS